MQNRELPEVSPDTVFISDEERCALTTIFREHMGARAPDPRSGVSFVEAVCAKLCAAPFHAVSLSDPERMALSCFLDEEMNRVKEVPGNQKEGACKHTADKHLELLVNLKGKAAPTLN